MPHRIKDERRELVLVLYLNLIFFSSDCYRMDDCFNVLQKHLLSNHLCTYDPSSMQVTIKNHLLIVWLAFEICFSYFRKQQ